MPAMRCEAIEHYKTLERALRLSAGALEAIVTLDVGPRVMHVSLPGGPNLFADDCGLKEDLPDGTVFEYFGGHRVWHSPEAFPRSYVSDSHPLERYELSDDGILMVQAEEPWTHIVKAVELRFKAGSLAVKSSLTNRGAWPIQTAVWSLFLGAPNGRLVLPVAQRDTGLLPSTHYVSWSYTRMDDPRVHWGRRFIVLDHDQTNAAPFKFGYPDELGWLAFINHGCCLVKRFEHTLGASYPDGGCSAEAYTAGWGIDIESLSPLQVVKPGETIAHDEEWSVFECPRRPAVADDEIAVLLEPFSLRPGSSCRSRAAATGTRLGGRKRRSPAPPPPTSRRSSYGLRGQGQGTLTPSFWRLAAPGSAVARWEL
jgi:hypothetical protein